jgi:hypothetical protein
MTRKLFAGAAFALLMGCGGGLPAGTYEVPVEVAYQRLIAGDMDDFRIARQCGILIHFDVEKELNKQVRWIVRSSGMQVAQFTVRLIPVDAQTTRFEIDVPAAPEGGEIYDGTKFYPRPALHQPLRPAIQELIAARIEQRPYDPMGLPSTDSDSVCDVQRAGLESGHYVWGVNDRPGMDARESARAAAADDASESYDEPAMGEPMDDARPEADPTW